MPAIAPHLQASPVPVNQESQSRKALAYYNEHDPKAAAWLRELIAAGHIPPGDVDERSITEVRPHELTSYVQCHFFAGIGGWALALRLAGWPDNRPVRTGSCPCQPFSIAGQGLGEADERHLWPNFRDLITFGEPTITFGEQVASKDGRDWLAGVRADLEGLGYEVGAADLCAASVGAPHPRQRLYWMARMEHAQGDGRQQRRSEPSGRGIVGGCGESVERMGDSDDSGRIKQCRTFAMGSELMATQRAGGGSWDAFDILPFRDGKFRRVEAGTFPLAHGVSNRVGLLRGYGNAIVPQLAAEFIQACEEAVGHDAEFHAVEGEKV